MRNRYEYLKSVQYMDSIDVPDIGNCVLQGFCDNGDQYYLIIRTVLGVSRILQIGPIEQGVPLQCTCQFYQMDYNDAKIDKIIDKFVDGKYPLTQISVFEIQNKQDIKQFTDQFPDLREMLYD